MEEAGYAALPLELRYAIPKSSDLPAFFNPNLFLATKLFLGFDPWAVGPKEGAEKLSEEGVPLLVIRSTDAEVVPFEHTRLFLTSYPETPSRGR